MTHSHWDIHLDRVEQQFNAVSVALLEGDPSALEIATAELQQLAVACLDMRKAAPIPHTVNRRLDEISEGLVVLRDNLMRRSAYVDHAVRVLVPAMEQTTYATGTRPYGAGPKQSGRLAGTAA